jgi:hypothetical protein
MAALMLAGEACLHVLFSAAQQTDPASGADSMPGMSMPGTGGAAAAAGIQAPLVAAHGAIGMIAVHVIAGLLCTWWLHRGERAAAALASRLLGEATAWLAPPGCFGVSPWPGLACAAPLLSSPPRVLNYPRSLVHVLVRRGPPGAGRSH